MPQPTAGGAPAALPQPEIALWRRLTPVSISLLLMAFVISRINVSAFFKAIEHTNYVALFAFATVSTLALMATDSMATVGLYRRAIGQVPFWGFFVVRAASYLPSLLNHHIGQAWITYYIAKRYRVPLWRVAGLTLLAYASVLGCLLVFAAASIPFNFSTMPWLAPAAATTGVAAAAYLAAIASAPAFLRRWQATAVLLEVGVTGHLYAFLYRVPHMIALFLATWLPFFFFGVNIPVGYALAAIPPLMLVAAFPFTPQGVGARDVLAFQLFANYATGTPDERRSVLAAATLSWAFTLIIVQLLISPMFMQRARALLRK